MTDPSKERIAAALALAEAVCALATAVDGDGSVPPALLQARQDALRAYRATAPKLRTRAEVDAERILNLDAFRAGVINGCALVDRDQALCREETAPDAEPTALAEAGIYDFRTVPTALWESLGHELTVADRCAQLRERIRQLEAQAALYDQECGMCGSTAEELVEYGEWRNASLQLLSPGEHSPSNDTERTTTP